MKVSTLEKIFGQLNQSRVRYLLAGGIAVNVHGYQRMTADIDLVIQMDSNNILKAMKSLEQLGYKPIIPVTAEGFANHQQREDWIKNKNMQVLSLQSKHYPETTVDLFVSEPFSFDEEYESAPEAELTSNISFKIVSIPTLIKMKEETGRPKDLDDIEHLKLIMDQSHEE